MISAGDSSLRELCLVSSQIDAKNTSKKHGEEFEETRAEHEKAMAEMAMPWKMSGDKIKKDSSRLL